MHTDPAAAALHVIRTQWPDLASMLDARTGGAASWPPVMGIAQLPDDDHRADDGRRGDIRPVPVRVDVLDTMQEITTALTACADRVAAAVQRPAMSHAPQQWPAGDRARRNQLADQDAADPRRWRYTGHRTATHAAAWLADRLAGRPGPFRNLGDAQQADITTTATGAAGRLLRAIGTERRQQRLTEPCPHCRSDALVLGGGDGTPPAVTCGACGRRWTEAPAAA